MPVSGTIYVGCAECGRALSSGNPEEASLVVNSICPECVARTDAAIAAAIESLERAGWE